MSTRDLIAPMTAASSPSPLVAAASSQFSASFAAWKAFTGTDDDFWFSGASSYPNTLSIDLGSGNAIAAVRYRVTADYQSTFTYAPKTWTFQGSNDNSAWTTLDTQTNVTDWSVNPKGFSFSNSTAYRYYRLNITVGNSATYVGVRELKISATSASSQYGFVWGGDSLGTDLVRVGSERTSGNLSSYGKWDTSAESNVAVAGERIDQQTATAVANVDSLLAGLSAYTHKYVVFQCGINDIAQGASAATTLSRLTTYVSARISAGWDAVIVFTLTKAASVTGGNETARVAYNALLLATPPSGSYVIDLDSKAEFSNTADTTYYQADGVHFTNVGAVAVAGYVLVDYPLPSPSSGSPAAIGLALGLWL